MANEIEVRRDNRDQRGLDVMPNIDDLFDRFFGLGGRFPSFPSLMGDLPVFSQRPQARVDMQETDQAYVLSAEVPGIPQDEIDITVNGNLLTLQAEHKEEDRGKLGFKRQYRRFQQSFSLPTTIDPNKIEAHYDNGMLEILLPKTEQAQARKVQVQSGKGGVLNRLTGKESKDKGAQKQEQQKH